MAKAECELCGKYVWPLQILVNGREYHRKCAERLTPEQWKEEVDLAMALPNPNSPDFLVRMERVDAYALKNKMGMYGAEPMTPTDIRRALAGT